MQESVKAYMPGLVARVVVKEGDIVRKDQEVVVINSMKTEFSVTSNTDGVVKKILVKEWDEVGVDAPLIILEVDKGQ